jgi:hypothetical protein
VIKFEERKQRYKSIHAQLWSLEVLVVEYRHRQTPVAILLHSHKVPLDENGLLRVLLIEILKDVSIGLLGLL